MTFNVFLDREGADLRRYLKRLHHLAGDRPLVLGELGMDAGDTRAARSVKPRCWIATRAGARAIERGVAGSCIFSWTDEWWVGGHGRRGSGTSGSPVPTGHPVPPWTSPHAGTTARGRGPAARDASWPSISVVICAYNAADTLDECLQHTCALEYPRLEIIVVDDRAPPTTRPRSLVVTPRCGS